METPRVYPSQTGGSISGKVGDATDLQDGMGGPKPRLDLVIVGSASRDMTSDDARGWRLGGSATYCSLAAARLGLRVGCVLGVDAAASTADELTWLEESGVDLRPVLLARGPVFENIERNGHRRQRWLSECDPIPADALPLEWRSVRGWLLAPIAGELAGEWSRVPGPGAAIGIGWQGMLREFAGDGWVERVHPQPSSLLEAAGLVSASVDDLPATTALPSLRKLAPLATIVLTAGLRGGLVIRKSGMARYPAIPATEVVDPTGAGDVLLAALMVGWLLHGELATSRSLRFAAAAASCAVEGMGLAAVPTSDQVAARLGEVAGAAQSDPA